MKYYYFVFIAIGFFLYEYFTGVSNQKKIDTWDFANKTKKEEDVITLKNVVFFRKLTSLGYSESTTRNRKLYEQKTESNLKNFEEYMQLTISNSLVNIDNWKKGIIEYYKQ